MDTIEIILSIISGLGLTGSGVLGYVLHRSTNERLAVAEADKAEAQANHEEWDLEHQRLEETHQTIMTLNGIIKEQGETISRLNTVCDDKQARLREAQDREYEANGARAKLSADNAQLIRDNGELKLRLQKHECVRLDCIHRDPPNEHTKAARARVATNNKSNQTLQ